jgi:hydroxymethylglutaryl-CoA lyase
MKKADKISFTETPRDAFQGRTEYFPSEKKAEYINLLLKCGFETVDVGSFVSPKAVPQMADTAEVISSLLTRESSSKLMVVVGNTRGAQDACKYESIGLIGFPYSTSPTFLQRNIHSDPEKAWKEMLTIQSMALNSGKAIRVYLSMAFGNPYGDHWSEDQIIRETERLARNGFRDIAFSDITGEGSADSIEKICSRLVNEFSGLKLGIHLHTKPDDWSQQVEAAWRSGIRNFEGAIGGFGGCPMTGYELLGNLDTYKLVDWCKTQGIETGIDEQKLLEARNFAIKLLQ